MNPGPLLLREFARTTADLEPEVAQLSTLAECGLPVARIVVIPPAAEAEFYRLNNLDTRLAERFRSVNLALPDDEDIEDLAPEAEDLVYSHFLLDEFIDSFYQALEGLPDELRVRRPGADGVTASGARAGLLALKSCWSAAWSFESVWRRLSAAAGLIPPPRALLLHAAPLRPLPVGLSQDASALLGRQLEVMGDPQTGISRIVERETTGAAADE